MDFFPIEGANVVLAKEQDEYKEIVGFFNPHTPSIHAGTGQEYDSGPSITVAFKPTMKEALALLNGKPLYLRVLGGRFPPVSLWVDE